jgi:4'-phosphopantetheinyl transferase
MMTARERTAIGIVEVPEASAGRVDVWTVWLGREAAAPELLSSDEAARASRFVFDRHRRRYVACRSTLRVLLGSYLGEPASDLCFTYTNYGKPELAGRAISFNVSHCDDLALIAVTLKHRLGVDIERLRPLEDLDGVAWTVFSSSELATLDTVPRHLKADAFFNCWTRKEAFIKAVGEGFSFPLKEFDVTLRPGEAAELVSIRAGGSEAQDWALFDLRPAEEFVGAVAVEDPHAILRMAGLIGGPVLGPDT